MSIFNFPALESLLIPDLAHEIEKLRLRCQGSVLWNAAIPLLHRLLSHNFTHYLPGDLHVKMDRMAMATSLETRSPMLDSALVEFVAALPPNVKIRRGQTKYILRKAFRNALPRQLWARKKHGFTVPLDHWFRNELCNEVKELILSPEAASRLYVNQGAVRALLHEHVSGLGQHGKRLWLLLNFEIWLRMLKDGRLWQPMMTETCSTIENVEERHFNYA
jgi:asparagine synthase (glutamine-hydrolysing)